MHEVFFIISVITIASCNCRIHLFQGTFHNIVHILNINIFSAKRLCLCKGKITDSAFFFFCKCVKNTICRFIHRIDNLFNIELFSCSVFLDYVNHLTPPTTISCLSALCFFKTTSKCSITSFHKTVNCLCQFFNGFVVSGLYCIYHAMFNVIF